MIKTLRKQFVRYEPYIGLLKPVRKKFAWGIIFGVIAGLAEGGGIPFLVDKALPVLTADPAPGIWVLIAYVAVFPFAMSIKAVCGFINVYLISFCGLSVLQQIQQRVHEKLQYLPLAFFHKNTVGDLMARVIGDAGSLQQVLTTVANDMVKQPMTLIGAVGFMIYQSFKETEVLFLMMFVGIIVLIIFPIQYAGRNLLKRAHQLQAQSGDISKAVGENLSAVREVRAFNLQKTESSRFEAALANFVYLSMKVVKYNNLIRPGIELMAVFGVSFAVVYMLVKGIGLEVAPLLLAFYFSYSPIKKFGEMHLALKRGEAAVDRLEHILNEEDTVPEASNPVSLGAIKGKVEFENVHFRYLEEWVLKDVNLSFDPGTVVALVGPSGAGKTTIADLIPRFYDVQKGVVKIDGHDVRSVSKHELRATVSVVSQDTFLFNDSILENIRIGNPDASDEQVHQAARNAFAHDFVTEMDEGYNTIVGERGTRLSGGQKQRIAIARAFLKNAPILILDEATSALDSESEKKIQTALETLIQGKTVFMIAHRFATIKMANTIVVMEDGLVHGVGNHSELYKSNELYTKLYDRQFID